MSFFQSLKQREIKSILREANIAHRRRHVMSATGMQRLCGRLKAGGQMSIYLKVIAKMAATPERLLKSLVFMHHYLIYGKEEDEDQLLLCLKSINEDASTLQQEFIKNIQQKEKPPLNLTGSIRSQTNQEPFSKEVYMLGDLVKPYVAYIQKIVSISDWYRQICQNQAKQFSSAEAWQAMNILKLVSIFSKSLSKLGRYFMKQYGELALAMLVPIRRDIYFFYDKLEQLIARETNKYLSKCNEQIDVQIPAQLLNLLDEIMDVNQRLYYIFIGRYFVANVDRQYMPHWIDFDQIKIPLAIKYKKKPQLECSLSSLNSSLYNPQFVNVKKARGSSETRDDSFKKKKEMEVLNK